LYDLCFIRDEKRKSVEYMIQVEEKLKISKEVNREMGKK
jgi:hypothetical protein